MLTTIGSPMMVRLSIYIVAPSSDSMMLSVNILY